MDLEFIDNLPRTKLVLPNERRHDIGVDVEKIDLDNITQLESLISTLYKLSLIVEHDVMVNGEKRRLGYRISMIEVACRLIASYVTLESEAQEKYILSSDKRCFKSIVFMALGLRRLIQKSSDDLTKAATPVPSSDNQSTEGKLGCPKLSSATSNTTIGQST